ncbi:MAG: hypothetical protein ACFFCO_00635 [Promethearchaeota archaeon]
MPGGFREIREYDEEVDEKQKRREKAEASLKAYDRYQKYFDEARRELRENPPSPEEAQESKTRIEAILAEASRQAEENISLPAERISAQQTSSFPSRELSSQERRFMPQESNNPVTEEEADGQSLKPQQQEQVPLFTKQNVEQELGSDKPVFPQLRHVDDLEEHQHTLRASEDPDFRIQYLPPRRFTPEAVEALHSICKDGNWIDPIHIASISDFTTYQQALCRFPLIQSLPNFDELHTRVRVYFQVLGKYSSQTWSHVPLEYKGISRYTIYGWIRGTSRPRLLSLLEQRAATIFRIQQRVAKIREGSNGIFTFQDVSDRINTTPFAHYFKIHPKYKQRCNDAERYLNVLRLIESGYHPSDLGTHFKGLRAVIRRYIERDHRPYLIRIAAGIPNVPTAAGKLWMPTTIDDSRIPSRWVQVPARITDYKQLRQVLEQLPTLTNADKHLSQQLHEYGPAPSFLKEWTHKFGPVNSIEERLSATAYLAGATLSDGHISLESTISSAFSMGLSTKYTWSKNFGDRVAYYYTSLGIPTKPGPIKQPNPPDPHETFQWYSVNTPMLTWFNEAVLGLPPGEGHTHNPAKPEWILTAPRSLQIKFIQGLFDGDGWAIVKGNEIGVFTFNNADFIEQLLNRVDLYPTSKEGKRKLVFRTQEGLKQATALPVFLSATGKQQNSSKIVEMIGGTRQIRTIDNLTTIRLIQELGRKPGVSMAQIRELVYDEIGVSIDPQSIKRIIEEGDRRLKIDWRVVRAYFHLLELQLKSPDTPHKHLAIKVHDETSVSRSWQSMTLWLSQGHVPRDVKRALSDGYPVDPKILKKNPQLYQYLRNHGYDKSE